MGFKTGRRGSEIWNDVQVLDGIIGRTKFNISGKSERDFELLFTTTLSAHDKIGRKLISQFDNETKVQSVYCFGKKHRPDLAIGDDGIAIEIKYINGSLDGVRDAIGQAIFYRLRYRFVVVLLVVAEKNQETYLKLVNGEEKDLSDIFKHLSDELNIFTYVVPAFTLKNNIKKVFESNSFILE